MGKIFTCVLALIGFFDVQPVVANEYILYVRPQGQLGKELSKYWKNVKQDSDISHLAITKYPPHCSLTGFFPITKSKAEYIQAVKEAMESLKNDPKNISVGKLVQNSAQKATDYITLSSSYLLAVTEAFMQNASVPSTYLKTFYHITLRNHVFVQNVQKKMKKIQSLERKINLGAKASWALYLYELDSNDTLTVIEEFPL